MLNTNIQKYRKAKKLSQEEMAVRLHIVRQTVSKWENALSVPDAEMLINIAELLDVPVSKLLGLEVEKNNTEDLTEELARLNEELARKNQREQTVMKANKIRGWILLLSFVAMLLSLSVNNPVCSVLLSGICVLAAVTILYRNLALLTSITTNDMKMKILRFTTLFNIIIMFICIITDILIAADIIRISENEEKTLALFVISTIMIFSGIISPKLPFTRHTGLRLPWTVQDEDTWNLAHRTIGYISLPLTLLYVGCSLTIDNFEIVTLIAMVLWIGIPGVVSGVFFWRKTTGKL